MTEHPPQTRLEQSFRGETPLRTLLTLYRADRWRLGLALVVYAIKASPQWAMPLVTANVVDIVSRPQVHSVGALWWNAGLLAALLAQNIPMHYVYARLISVTVRGAEQRLREAIGRRFQQLSILYYTRARAGALQAKVLRDVEAVEQLTRQVFQEGPALLLTLAVALTVTALRAPWFLALFAVLVPVAALLVRALNKPIQAQTRAFRQEIEGMSGRVTEMLQMLPVTRAHGAEQGALEDLSRTLEGVKARALKLDSVQAFFGSVMWVTFNGFNAACLLIAGWAAFTHALPLGAGDVVLMAGYFGTLTGTVLGLVNLAPQITKGFESVGSIAEVLGESDVEHNEGKARVDNVRGDFRFEGVGFRYPEVGEREGGAHALHDFSLHVQEGETLAIVGPSGGGKSTLLSLVTGLLRPSEGRVLLDGRDMGALDLRSYRRFLSVVPQETVLFHGSVRDNVLCGVGGVSEQQLRGALRDAGALDFALALPQGLDTVLGERGAKLSGGQKQRLAIARALVRDPKVLVLDEATSALDTDSEAAIQEALTTLLRGRTTFVVAHRLSTIRGAHRIVVLEEGRIREIGSHGELLALGGAYAKLHRVGAAS